MPAGAVLDAKDGVHWRTSRPAISDRQVRGADTDRARRNVMTRQQHTDHHGPDQPHNQAALATAEERLQLSPGVTHTTQVTQICAIRTGETTPAQPVPLQPGPGSVWQRPVLGRRQRPRLPAGQLERGRCPVITATTSTAAARGIAAAELKAQIHCGSCGLDFGIRPQAEARFLADVHNDLQHGDRPDAYAVDTQHDQDQADQLAARDDTGSAEDAGHDAGAEAGDRYDGYDAGAVPPWWSRGGLTARRRSGPRRRSPFRRW